jgi:hypothetical protein
MAVQDPNSGDGFSVVPLEADEHTATVDVQDAMVQVGVLGPVTVTRITLTRREARAVALAMVEASQAIDTEEEAR